MVFLTCFNLPPKAGSLARQYQANWYLQQQQSAARFGDRRNAQQRVSSLQRCCAAGCYRSFSGESRHEMRRAQSLYVALQSARVTTWVISCREPLNSYVRRAQHVFGCQITEHTHIHAQSSSYPAPTDDGPRHNNDCTQCQRCSGYVVHYLLI